MKRALGFLALLLVWPAAARADGMDDAVAAVVGLDADCQVALDHANLLLEVGGLGDAETAQVENNRSLLELMCPMLRDDAADVQDTLVKFRACTDDCDNLETALWFVLKKAQVEGETVMELMVQLQAIGNGEYVPADEPVDAPSQHTIYLSTIGVSIDVPGTWEVSLGDGADLIIEYGDTIAAVMTQSEYDCETTVGALRNAYDAARDVTIALTYAWSGVEFSKGGNWGGLYCRSGDGSTVIVSAPAEIASILIGGIETAMNPSGTETSSDGYVPGVDPDPTPERPRKRTVIGGFLPLTAHLGLVRRSDDMGAGFGFGLQLGRLGWREDERFTIGYELGAAAATGFWELGAQVRPGISPMFKDLPVDAYVALGVDATGGKHQEETDVQPVFGGGAEVLFTLPGIGADLAAQALADPGGFHSYTLHGGLLFGANEGRFRVGASYVKFADDTNVVWMTLGITKLELR